MPELMQDIQVVQSSPFHSITSVTVHLDPEPKEGGDVYPESGKLAIAKPGYMKLLSAAGMEEIPEKCRSELREDGVFYAKAVIKWTQPDGKDIVLSGDKLMDLRIGGSRWQKAHEKALDHEVTDWAKQNGYPKQKKPNGYDESVAEWASRVLVALEMDGEHTELLRLLDLKARQKANRQIRQAAQFGVELAQSGAVERAVKGQLGLKSTYTKEEIVEGFTILRSEFRWDMIREALGTGTAKALTTAFIAKQLGVGVEDVLQIEAGGPAIRHPQEPEAEEPVNPFVEEEAITETDEDSEEARLFTTPVQDDSMSRIRNKMISYHGWRDFDRTEASKITSWIFYGKMFSDLSEGEMRLLIVMYDKLAVAKKAKVSARKRQEQAVDIKAQIDRCVAEKRMWRKPAEDAKQPELPGMPEEEPNEPDQEGESSEPGTTDDSDS